MVVDGTVYVGDGNLSGQDGRGRIYALDSTEGTKRWDFRPEGESVSGPLAVQDDIVYAVSGERIYAVDASDGTEQWQFGAEETLWGPTVADGTVYVGSTDGNLYALAASDGTLQWDFPVESTVGIQSPSPAVSAGTVYVGDTEAIVYALDATEGTEQWRFESGDNRIDGAPAVVNGTVYVGTSAAMEPGHVYALDATEGTEQWSYTVPGDGVGVEVSPAVMEETVFVGDRRSRIYALDASDGASRWTFTRAEGSTHRATAPVAVNDTVYFGNGEGDVYALAASDGALRWSFRTDGSIHWSPAVVDGTIYFGNWNGEVYALSGESTTPSADTPTRTDTSTPTDTPAPTGPASDTGGGSGDNPAGSTVPSEVGLIGGAAILGGGFVGWRHLSDGDDTSENTSVTTTPDSPGGSGSSSTTPVTSFEPSADAQRTGPPAEIPQPPALSQIDYEAISKAEYIGAGGNADVHRATVETAAGERTIALKEPRVEGALHSNVVEQLMEEAETWDELDDHDHVVAVLDWDSQPLPWIAMEYMDGGGLGQRAGELDLDQALRIAIAITKAVHHAHRRGVAHLDLKPENVLFREVEDGLDVPKIADWGLSKQLLDRSESVDGLSPHYAAPEQFDDGYGPADDITDVYQLGAVLYELFTGEPPFEGQAAQVMHDVLHEQPTPPSEIASVPPALDAILLRALAKEKDDRYESVIYLRDDLQDLYESL